MPFKEQFTTLLVIPFIVAILAALALSFVPKLRSLSFWWRAGIFVGLLLTATAVVYVVVPKDREGDTTIAGTVRDQSNGAGIGGVTIGVDGRSETCVSDDIGNFSMRLQTEPGIHARITLIARKTGYGPLNWNVVPPQHDLQLMLQRTSR